MSEGDEVVCVKCLRTIEESESDLRIFGRVCRDRKDCDRE